MGEKEGLKSNKIGSYGEEIALKYLLDRGFVLVEKNWRNHHLEIDLIMFQNGVLRIVEVRSLRAPVLQQPYETVNNAKKRKLIRAAASYVRRNRLSCEVCFDIVSIVFERDNHTIEYIPQAFLPFIN